MSEFSTEQLLDDIARALSSQDFDTISASALAGFDALNQTFIEQEEIRLACRQGCSLCCSLRVDVFAHEIFPLARHIRSHFTPGEISRLLERLAQHTETVTALTPFEHATTNLPCPMLQEGSCTVYEVRPHSCRRHHSQDLAACQFTFDHPTDLETPAAHHRELYQTLSAAMQQNAAAYVEAGFDPTIYELGSAVYEALSDPESWTGWLGRQNAFLQASVTPTE